MNDIDALLEISRQAHQSGDLNTAAQGYAAVLAAQPQTPDAWHLAGLVAHQSGRSQEGIQWIEQAIRLREEAEYFTNLAGIHESLENYEEAERLASRALSVAPDFPVAHFRRGVALARQSRSDEALHHLKIALDAEFAPETTLQEIALALQASGDIAMSIRALQVSLELNPNQASVYHLLSKLVLSGEYEFTEAQIAAIENLLLVYADIPSQQRQTSQMHFALGNHFERSQQPHRAFQHYVQGNRSVEQDLARGRAMEGHSTEHPLAFASPDDFARKRLLPGVRFDVTALPLFVLGSPRSGSSLITQVLCSHPEVASIGETPAVESMVRAIGDHVDSTAVGNGEGSGVTGTEPCPAIEAYLGQLRDADPRAARVVDKLPDNVRWLGCLLHLFPNAQFFWSRRDPRDIAFSNFTALYQSRRLRWETASLERIAVSIREVNQTLRAWSRACPGRIAPVFYERLVTSTESTSRDIIRATGLTWSDECLEPHRAENRVDTASAVQVRQPIYQSSVGRWKRFAPFLQPLFDLLQDEIGQYEAELAAAD